MRHRDTQPEVVIHNLDKSDVPIRGCLTEYVRARAILDSQFPTQETLLQSVENVASSCADSTM